MHRESLDQANETGCSIATINSPNIEVGHFSHVQNRHRYVSPCPNRINITVSALWVATPLLSTVSVAAVCVAVSTNQWLVTQENIKNGNYTGRGDQEYFPKNTISGLWTLCYNNPGKQGFFCSNIEYFPKEEYSPDLKDSTMAIPYTVTKSAAFFIVSTFLLFLGEFCCLYGHFSRQRRLLTFISGVIFIISGLLMLIGLVMYISIFKAEVGGKLRPTSQLQPAVFTYKYGYSFILYVSGFVSTEISGTCAVFLYIYWHQKDWRRKECDSRSKFVAPTNVFDIDSIYGMYPFCRKHPPYLSSYNGGCSVSDEIFENFTPSLPRRFYFDGLQPNNLKSETYSSFCLKHSMSCNMVNELMSDGRPKKQNRKVGTSDLFEDYPPFPSERRGHQITAAYSYEYLGRNCYSQLSVPNININFTNDEFQNSDECLSGASHDHDFVPFDLDDNALVPPKRKNLENIMQKDEFIYTTLSKTTPV